MVSGVTVMVAVGAGELIGGGGGGGGGTGFLWQPAAKTKVTNAASDAVIFECCVFKVYSSILSVVTAISSSS